MKLITLSIRKKVEDVFASEVKEYIDYERGGFNPSYSNVYGILKGLELAGFGKTGLDKNKPGRKLGFDQDIQNLYYWFHKVKTNTECIYWKMDKENISKCGTVGR
jgi:hypothetical protein